MIDDTIQSNKLTILGKLTASLLHEIRNPLSAVKLGLAHLEMMESELPTEANEIVNASKDALERIENLIFNLLDFSRKNNCNNVAVQLNIISDYAISLLQSNIQKNKIVLYKEYNENLPLLYLNKFKAIQIFLNLISNAIESFYDKKECGSITIRTFIDLSGSVVWQIKDEGMGIDDNDKNKIFNDFYTSKINGTGLGLSVCRQILNEYNSNISFESKYGEGSVFNVNFNSMLLKVKNDEVQNINN